MLPYVNALQLSWADETKSALTSGELPRDVQGAERMIDLHQELKSGIDARNDR